MDSNSLKTAGSYLIAIIGIYISLNAVLAIPLLDENNNKIKELGNDLKDDLKSMKLSFYNHLADFKYDSITSSRFDSAAKKIKLRSNYLSMVVILNDKINDFKRIFENGSDLQYYNFINLNQANDINESHLIKNSLDERFKKLCDSAERTLNLYLIGVRLNVNRWYSISVRDSLQSTIEAYQILYNSLYTDEPNYDFSLTEDCKVKIQNRTPFNAFFYVSNLIINSGSTNIGLIIGIFGVALFGCVIGSYKRNTIVLKNNTSPLASDILPLLLKSISSSLLTFLSIKGGISFITADKDSTINPYFIMLVCFVAAVFSDEIWVWAKSRIIPGQSDTAPKNP